MFSALRSPRRRLRPAASTSNRHEQEEGSTAVELAILTPLVVLLVLLVVQFVLFIHARQVVTAAAEQGVRSERLSRVGGGEGVQAALGFASRIGGRAVTGVDAQVVRTVDSVTVNVSGDGQSIIPWMNLRVTGTSSGAIDQWTGDN